jgi:hypothetical protein
VSIGALPNIAGGLSIGACPAYCDPRYAPRCSNDCMENVSRQVSAPCRSGTTGSLFAGSIASWRYSASGIASAPTAWIYGIALEHTGTGQDCEQQRCPQYCDSKYFPGCCNDCKAACNVCGMTDCSQCPGGECYCPPGNTTCLEWREKCKCPSSGSPFSPLSGGGSCGLEPCDAENSETLLMPTFRRALSSAYVNTSRLPTEVPCVVAPGLSTPVPVPSSGSSALVTVRDVDDHGGFITGLWVTCQETGVTYPSAQSVEYFADSVADRTFSTPGGVGISQADNQAHNFGPGSTTSWGVLNIEVHRV